LLGAVATLCSMLVSCSHLRLHFFLFDLLTPPPPRSTLFPYTTLFRSTSRSTSGDVNGSRLSARLAETRNDPAVRSARSVRMAAADRKSTRLNSSHEWISYAVFCLKKKIKKVKTKEQCDKSSGYHIVIG